MTISPPPTTSTYHPPTLRWSAYQNGLLVHVRHRQKNHARRRPPRDDQQPPCVPDLPALQRVLQPRGEIVIRYAATTVWANHVASRRLSGPMTARGGKCWRWRRQVARPKATAASDGGGGSQRRRWWRRSGGDNVQAEVTWLSRSIGDEATPEQRNGKRLTSCR